MFFSLSWQSAPTKLRATCIILHTVSPRFQSGLSFPFIPLTLLEEIKDATRLHRTCSAALVQGLTSLVMAARASIVRWDGKRVLSEDCDTQVTRQAISAAITVSDGNTCATSDHTKMPVMLETLGCNKSSIYGSKDQHLFLRVHFFWSTRLMPLCIGWLHSGCISSFHLSGSVRAILDLFRDNLSTEPFNHQMYRQTRGTKLQSFL